jgi:hypothetical protein
MDLATIEPVQPNPMVTTSVGGSLVAIVHSFFGGGFLGAASTFANVHQS